MIFLKRLAIILTWAIVSIVVLILVAGLITQTSFFKSLLKDIAVTELNQILDADLSIGHLDGNLFNKLEIQEVVLSTNQDTIISIAEINLSFDLLRFLNNEITINELKIDSPQIFLYEDATGIWNFNKIISQNSELDTTRNENGKAFPYVISLESLGLFNGHAEIKSNEKLIPEIITNLHINLNGIYGTEMLELNLDGLAFQSENPNLILKKFAFNFKQSEDGLHLRNLTLKTGKNIITSEAEYHKAKNNFLNLNSQKLNLSEIDFIVPGFSLDKNPDIQIESRFNQDSLQLVIDIETEDESLNLRAKVANYQALVEDNNSEPIYFSLDLLIPELRLHDWSNQIPVDRIQGQLSASGTLTAFDDIQVRVNGTFYDIEIEGHTVDVFQIDAHIIQNKANGDLQVTSEFGNLDLEFEIDDVFDQTGYKGLLSVTHLDLSTPLSNDMINTDLNFNLFIQGAGAQLSDQTTFLKLDLLSSRINEFMIDTLFARGGLTGTAYHLETLKTVSNLGTLVLAGYGDINTVHSLTYAINLGDLQPLAAFVGADTIQSSGQISGQINGNLTSLKNELSFEMRNLQYNDLKLDSLAGNASFSLQDSLFSGSTEFESKDLLVGNKLIEIIRLSAVYEDGRISSDIEIQFDQDLRSSLTATTIPDSILVMTFPQIEIDFMDERWNGSMNKLSFDTGTNDLEIKEFLLQSQTSEDPRQIAMNGILSPTGNEEFTLQMEGLRPGSFFSYFGIENNIDARINSNLEIAGTADIPLIKGNLSFEDGSVGGIKYEGIYSVFEYRDDRFNFDFLLNFNGRDSLTAGGNLPVHFSFTDSVNILDPAEPIHFNVRSESIPLAIFLSNLKTFPEVAGVFLCDLTIENNLNDPRINGNLKIKDGLLRSAYWGIDYQNIALNILAKDDIFLLEKFQILTNKGKLEAAGNIQFDFDNIEKPIIYSDINLKAEKFFLLQHKDFETQISADIKYQMEEDQPKVDGFIEINWSNFYLPKIRDRAGYVTEVVEESKPVLVQARNKKLGIDKIIREDKTKTAIRDTLHVPGFLEKLEGNLVIRFPRNTWIRNPQIRLELGGDIQVTMENGDVFIKGPLNFVRGQYDLLGRRFTVIEGNIEFQGEEEINPPILLEAEYIYRTTGREKKALVLKITGNLNYPVVSFYESNNKISAEDAASIVLYGRKKDELSYGTQTDLTESGVVNTAAMGIVSNMVSDRLSRAVGDDLTLDIIEVNAQDNWKGANFVVGKYITENIFLTYKREFGQSQDNNLYPETISMEYEIMKNFFFQMIQGDPRESGYDLLFKFDWD